MFIQVMDFDGNINIVKIWLWFLCCNQGFWYTTINQFKLCRFFESFFKETDFKVVFEETDSEQQTTSSKNKIIKNNAI